MLEVEEVALQASNAAPAAWLRLAREADGLHAPALAERAATRAGPEPGAAFLVSDARRQRRDVALPLDGSIPASREADYVSAVNGVLEPLSEEELSKARVALRAMGNAFPGSPGLALGTCAQAVAEKGATARAACTRAVSVFEEAPRAQLLLGIVHGRAGRWAEARQQFQRSMALDDSAGEVWARLSGACGMLGDAAAQRELEAPYLAKFGFALRPKSQ